MSTNLLHDKETEVYSVTPGRYYNACNLIYTIFGGEKTNSCVLSLSRSKKAHRTKPAQHTRI